MRFWFHLLVVLTGCSLVWLHPISPTPEQAVRQKAQRLLDDYYGPGHARVTVTVHQAKGQRTVRDQQLGDQALVVGSQERDESYHGRYQNHMHSEKLELPRKLVISHQQEWLENTCVAVVLDRQPGPEVNDLLRAGLGLRPESGDQIQVVHALR
ncbi:MAG: hypothetical protein U0931_26470 [Vulcanimicrobiota bacterium]